MASFGTEAIINPFDTFSDRLALALHSPDMHLLYEWLTAIPDTPLPERLYPPRGTWVICGYGRFGKAVQRYLQYEGISTVIIEQDPVKTRAPKDAVIGRGTEAVTLREAHIENAVAVVAGTDDDANNLSIIVTAREINPHLFLVARQNESENDAIFRAAKLDLVMQHARTISRRILTLVTVPLLTDFLRLARHQKPGWAQSLIDRMRLDFDGVTPDIWSVTLVAEQAPAVQECIRTGNSLTLACLVRDPDEREQSLHVLPLLLKRGNDEQLLPPDATGLQTGDQILFCGRAGMAKRQQRALYDVRTIHYLLSGETRPEGAVWRWLEARR